MDNKDEKRCCPPVKRKRSEPEDESPPTKRRCTDVESIYHLPTNLLEE